jgi:hypothetical protein
VILVFKGGQLKKSRPLHIIAKNRHFLPFQALGAGAAVKNREVLFYRNPRLDIEGWPEPERGFVPYFVKH